MYIRALAAVVVLAAAAAPALAQSCGGCAGPAVTGSPGAGRSWPASRSLGLRVFEEYEVKDRSYDGRHRVENDFSEDLYVGRTAATLRYGVSDDWAVELTLTRVHFSYNLKPPGARSRIRRVFEGLGDSSLLVGRAFDLGPVEEPPPLRPELRVDAAPPRRRPLLGAWLGVSAPTGEPERPDPRIVTRDVSVTNLQTGTGTWDPQARVRLDVPGERVDWFAEVGARVPLAENRYDYRTGAVWAVSAGASVPLATGLDAALSVALQDVARDRFRGEDVAVGGGRWIYATPALRYALSESVALDASVRFAVWRDTDTKLSDSRFALQVGLSFTF